MKIKTLLAALLVAAVTASVALAKPPEKGEKGEHGKPAKTAAGDHGKKSGSAACAGKRSKLEFQGTIASVGADSVALAVKQANGHARELKGTQVTVQVDDRTTVRRNGHATLADLKAGDRAHVHAWACRSASADAATAPTAGSAAPAAQTIVAVKIDAHPAKAAGGDSTTPTTP
jgi:hypothetical protein